MAELEPINPELQGHEWSTPGPEKPWPVPPFEGQCPSLCEVFPEQYCSCGEAVQCYYKENHIELELIFLHQGVCSERSEHGWGNP